MAEQKLVKTHNLKIKIRKKCLEAGITTAYQLQVAAGIAPSVAQNLFNENFSEISLATLEKLLEALNCTAADIFVKEKSALQTAKEILKDARRVLVLTGAGVSAESGVPTFRGGGGASVWRGMPFEQLSSAKMVEENLPLVWEWFDYRREVAGECEPNAAHTALRDWQRAGDFDEFTLVTQNVDGLHRRAGSTKILELHGNIWRARCLMCNETFDVRDLPADERPPVCKMCGDFLRPNVVLFGENLPVKIMETAAERAAACDVCLVVGTSALVYPAASLPEIARQSGAKIIEINPEPTALTESADVSLRGKAGEILPQLSSVVLKNLNDADEFVSQTEAAEIKGVSRQRIQQLVKSGKLKVIGEGHDARIKIEDLMNLAEGKKGRPRKSRIENNAAIKKTSVEAQEYSSENDFRWGIKLIANGELTETDIPSSVGDWEKFALTFNLEKSSLEKCDSDEIYELAVAAFNGEKNIPDLSLDELRAVLFAVQRQKRWNDGYAEFDGVALGFVEKLLDAIRQKVRNKTTQNLQSFDENSRGDEGIFPDDEDEKILDKVWAEVTEETEQNIKVSGKHFLLYWREESVAAHSSSGQPLDVVASNQLGRVSRNDTIWLVTISSDGELVLAGRMRVDRVTDYAEATRITRDQQLWKADFYALPAPGEAEYLNPLNLEELAFDLRFNSQTADRFDKSRGKISGQQMQTMRELTAESANLLTEIWEAANAGAWIDVNGGIQSALEDFEEAARLNPNDAMAQYNLGVALDAHGEHERAIDAYLRSLELDPNEAAAHYNLGCDYLQIRELEKAVDAFIQAALLANEFAPAQFMLAVAYGEMENFHEAIAATERGLRIEPHDAQAYSNLGDFYAKLGNRREALESYERSLELAPDSARVYLSAGKTANALGEFEKAVRYFRRAAEFEPDNFAAILSLGAAYLKRERGADALPVFPEPADEIDLQNPLLIYNLGLAFLALDEPDAAGEQIEVLEKMQSAFAEDLRELCRAARNRQQ